MNVVNLPIAELAPYENHARKSSNVARGVAESIRRFGFRQPIVVDRNKTIVCGHARYLAAKRLGLDVVPCVIADDLSPEAVDAYRIIDNKLGEIATWDPELLQEELQKIRVDFAAFEIDFSADLALNADFASNVEPSNADSDKSDEKRSKKGKRDPNAPPKSFRMIVTCDDEEDQEALFERLVAEGYKVKLCNL